MTGFDAFHLPGLEDRDVDRWDSIEMGALRARFPVLRPEAWHRLAARLRAARHAALEPTPASEIARRVGEVARRFGERGDPARARAAPLLAAATAYSPAMTDLVLDRMAADWRPDVLAGLLDAEFGDPRALDDFVATPARRRRAFGPGLALNIFAGNVPGVGVTALIRCLLVKAAAIGKTARSEPVLPVLFARLLAEHDPPLGDCLAVTYWPGGDQAAEGAALQHADAVVVYGGEATIRAVRARAPARARLIEHGPRISVAVTTREALAAHNAAATAADIARAVATFDQLGCTSPHIAYVEDGAETAPADFARAIASALAATQHDLPRGRLTPAEAAAFHDFRAAAEFRELAGHDVHLLSSPADPFTVVFDADPTFSASCLFRTLLVKPLRRLDDLPRHLEPARGILQTIGFAGDHARLQPLAASLAGLAVSRFAPIPHMPWPPAAASHDGQRPLAELVTWLDFETDPR